MEPVLPNERRVLLGLLLLLDKPARRGLYEPAGRLPPPSDPNDDIGSQCLCDHKRLGNKWKTWEASTNAWMHGLFRIYCNMAWQRACNDCSIYVSITLALALTCLTTSQS